MVVVLLLCVTLLSVRVTAQAIAPYIYPGYPFSVRLIDEHDPLILYVNIPEGVYGAQIKAKSNNAYINSAFKGNDIEIYAVPGKHASIERNGENLVAKCETNLLTFDICFHTWSWITKPKLVAGDWTIGVWHNVPAVFSYINGEADDYDVSVTFVDASLATHVQMIPDMPSAYVHVASKSHAYFVVEVEQAEARVEIDLDDDPKQSLTQGGTYVYYRSGRLTPLSTFEDPRYTDMQISTDNVGHGSILLSKGKYTIGVYCESESITVPLAGDFGFPYCSLRMLAKNIKSPLVAGGPQPCVKELQPGEEPCIGHDPNNEPGSGTSFVYNKCPRLLCKDCVADDDCVYCYHPLMGGECSLGSDCIAKNYSYVGYVTPSKVQTVPECPACYEKTCAECIDSDQCSWCENAVFGVGFSTCETGTTCKYSNPLISVEPATSKTVCEASYVPDLSGIYDPTGEDLTGVPPSPLPFGAAPTPPGGVTDCSLLTEKCAARCQSAGGVAICDCDLTNHAIIACNDDMSNSQACQEALGSGALTPWWVWLIVALLAVVAIVGPIVTCILMRKFGGGDGGGGGVAYGGGGGGGGGHRRSSTAMDTYQHRAGGGGGGGRSRGRSRGESLYSSGGGGYGDARKSSSASKLSAAPVKPNAW